MPVVVQLGRHPDLFAGNTGLLDTLTDLCLIAIIKSAVHSSVSFYHGKLGIRNMPCHLRINVTVSMLQSNLDSLLDLVGLGLPGTQTDGRDLVAGVEGEGPPIHISVSSSSFINYALGCSLGVVEVRHLANLHESLSSVTQMRCKSMERCCEGS